ncbi:MAG: transglycosylase SLT domain-containing protein [Betaproteobacteria bacterium]
MQNVSGFRSLLRSASTWLRHGLAALGLLAALVGLCLWLVPSWRAAGEDRLLVWLERRSFEDLVLPAPDPQAAERATAIDPASLPPPQARMSRWLASTYKVAPEPVAALVREAHFVGPRLKLQPTMIRAVMATESSLNPFSESSAGAQGLMQVMPKVHARRFEEHGGPMTAFDPLTNLRVGARVLHDCIKLTGGSVEDGLRFYLGGSRVDDALAAEYIAKVMALKARLEEAALTGGP